MNWGRTGRDMCYTLQPGGGTAAALTHPGFGQLLDLLHLGLGQHLQVAHNVRAVPLILLLEGPQQQPWVPVPILVAAEQAAAPRFVLQGTQIKTKSMSGGIMM